MSATDANFNMDRVVKRRKRGPPKYNSYIHKVLAAMTGKEIGISSKSVQIIHLILADFEARLTDSAMNVAKFDKKKTLNENHVKAAVGMLLPSEIAQHANNEIEKAITQFHTNA